MNATNKPIGFILTASLKLPLTKDKIARVEPQEGQGIFVKYLIKQTSTGSKTDCLFSILKQTQIYPATQAIIKIEYSLFLLRTINTKIAVFSACFFLL